MSINSIRIKLVLALDTVQSFTGKMFGFKRSLVNSLNLPQYSNKGQLFTITSIRKGSVIVDGELSVPEGVSPNAAGNAVSANIH